MNLWNEISPKESEVPSQRKAKRPLSPNGSHGVALNRSLKVLEISTEIPDNTTVLSLTVRMENTSLTPRHLRLMLEVLLYEIVYDGIDLYQYLMLSHLYFKLLGSKYEARDFVSEEQKTELRLLLLSEVLMKDLRDKDFSLEQAKNKMQISPDLKKSILINDLIMSDRTYKSRREHWKPEKYLLIRPVFAENLIERSGNSERYSSYCKGYGESHPSAHYKKTRPSAELDGKELSEPKDFSLETLRLLLVLNLLDLRNETKIRKN